MSPDFSFSMASASGRCELLHVDGEIVEQQAPGDGGAASGLAEIHHLALELLDVRHIGAHHDVDLLIEQLRHVDDLLHEVRAELAGLGVVLEHVRLGDAHVDAAQEHHVLDVLRHAPADDGQHAEIVAVVHHLGDVRGDGEVGVARAAGHDGDDVLVEPRPIILAQAVARSRIFDLRFVGFAARCCRGGKGDQAQPNREGDTHYYPSTMRLLLTTERPVAGKTSSGLHCSKIGREIARQRWRGATSSHLVDCRYCSSEKQLSVILTTLSRI